MSEVFFEQLSMPRPDIDLGVGSGSQARQTAEIMIAMEPALEEKTPDWVLVYGDVNSTLAAALVSAKLGLKVAHVEAGLRSFDWRMPEEINRVVTDRLADLHFTSSRDGDAHLRSEGVPDHKIQFVGNVMIDTLLHLLPEATSSGVTGLSSRYALVTVHRPANVDDAGSARRLLGTLSTLLDELQVVFPVHPRTRCRLESYGLALPHHERLLPLDPLGYLEFLALLKHATVVVTDSGGVQEETTFLGVPCLTLRQSTERPVTVTEGTNVLVGNDDRLMRRHLRSVLAGDWKQGTVPERWDGRAAERIAEVLLGLAQK